MIIWFISGFAPIIFITVVGYLVWRKFTRPSTPAGEGQMSLFSKMSDVFRANFNDLLDNATDPMKQLHLMLEDMRVFRRQQATRIGQAMGSQKQVAADLNKAVADQARWEAKAKLFASTGKDDAAKDAIKHQMRAEALVQTLTTANTTAEQSVATLQNDLKALDERIDELESKRSVYDVRQRTAEATKGIHDALSAAPGAPYSPEVEDRVEQALRRKEGEAEAAVATESLLTPAPEREEQNAEIEARLQQMKAKPEGNAA